MQDSKVSTKPIDSFWTNSYKYKTIKNLNSEPLLRLELQMDRKHSAKKVRHFAIYDNCFRMYQVFNFYLYVDV